MTSRTRRMGRNEALFREINEHIVNVSRTLPVSELFEILCECSRLDCVEKIPITKDAYLTARVSADTFIVLPDHHLPEAERVVVEVDGFLVVEKTGEARAGVREAEEASGGFAG